MIKVGDEELIGGSIASCSTVSMLLYESTAGDLKDAIEQMERVEVVLTHLKNVMKGDVLDALSQEQLEALEETNVILGETEEELDRHRLPYGSDDAAANAAAAMCMCD